MTCSTSYYNDNNQCIIHDLVIDPADVASLRFPVQESITLNNVRINYLSQEVMERMKWVSKLTINNGDIGRIYLKSDMQKLIATRSETFEVIIGDEQNNYLEELTVTFNNLRNIPENVENLKALTTLSLGGNKIEIVHLNKLHGLQKLTSIDLSGNRIYHLVPADNEFNLARLKVLDLSNNYLKELDFDNWNLQRLQTLTISYNHLTYLANLDENTFPFLHDLSLSDNLFDCRWRDDFLAILKNITMAHSDVSLDCSRMTQLSPATYNKLNISDLRDGGFQFDNKEQLEEQINSIVEAGMDQSKQIQKLSESMSYQAKLINDANEKLLAQQAVIDDLMARVEGLVMQMKQLKQQEVLPTSRSVAKGLTEILIQEISDVIRKNLQEEE